MEGTGLLKSGVLVNVGSSDTVFEVVDRKIHPFGLGNDDNNIYPFTSVASNDLPQGTRLYIKILDGLKLPSGQVHNGCVRIDDTGDSFSGCQLDFYVFGRSKDFNGGCGNNVSLTSHPSRIPVLSKTSKQAARPC